MRSLRRLEAIVSALSREARIAANIARHWQTLGRDRAMRLARLYGVSMGILTLARVLAAAEAAGL